MYQFSPGTTIGDLIWSVTEGNALPDDVELYLAEGSTIPDAVDAIESTGTLNKPITIESLTVTEELQRYWFLQELPIGESLVGYLFPDTYWIARESRISDVLSRVLTNTEMKLRSVGIDSPGFRSSGGLTLHEIVTLASIVQMESVAGEMAIVAEVFLNRIRSGWRLESDATINFILGTNKLIPTASDIHVDSPYNTYLISGLPPGPIGNPGEEAIQAVLEPADHDYFFFLHTPESQMVLSKTFEEHLRARAKYWE